MFTGGVMVFVAIMSYCAGIVVGYVLGRAARRLVVLEDGEYKAKWTIE